MTHRDQQKQATRRTLVSKALRLCARHGFGPIRTADVARAAGLSHGAVFVHFPTRESLLDEVLSTFARTLTDALHDRVASGAGLKAFFGLDRGHGRRRRRTGMLNVEC